MVRFLPVLPLLLLQALLGLVPPTSHAQFTETFDDDSITDEQPWAGDLDYWRLEASDSGSRLRSDGPARSDTLELLTRPAAAFGTWQFRYGYEGGPLSNFNQVRVRLWFDDDPSDPRGFYLMLGSNDRTVKLYRYAGNMSQRTLLAEAEPDLFPADSLAAVFTVERDYSGTWSVAVDGVHALRSGSEPDLTTPSGGFGIWVKHSSLRGGSHWFDDIFVSTGIASDTTAPAARDAVTVSKSRISVLFDEAVEPIAACSPETYRLLPAGMAPASVWCPPGIAVDSVALTFTEIGHAADLGLTVTGISDPSGNMRMTTTVGVRNDLLRYRPEKGNITINEIDYAPISSAPEFIELVNRTDRSLDLSLLTLADDKSATAIVPERRLLGPAEMAVATRDTVSLRSHFDVTGLLQPAAWPSLNNSGDLVALLVDGDTVDAVRFDTDWGGSVGSLERRDPNAPSDFPGNWGSTVDPRGGTPGAVNSIYKIDRTPPDITFAAQSERGSTVISAMFSEALPAATLGPANLHLNGRPASRVRPAADAYSSTFDFEFSFLEPGIVAAADIVDASRNPQPLTETVLHVRPEAGQVVINEILYEPVVDPFDGRPDQVEFVEIRSRSGHPLALSRCSLKGPLREDGSRDVFRVLPLTAGVAPHDVSILVARNEEPGVPYAWPRTPRDAPILSLDTPTLRLTNKGGTLMLDCGLHEPVDSVQYNPVWHDATVSIHRGRSLERIDPGRPANDPLNWTTSVDTDGATPGLQNSITSIAHTEAAQAGDVVINEVMFEPGAALSDPGAVQSEYVELLNISGKPIDLNGMTIVKSGEQATPDTARIGYAPTVLEPAAFAVVAALPSSAAGTSAVDHLQTAYPALAAPPAVVIGLRQRRLSLPNQGGALALLNHDGATIDRVRFSPDWHHPHLASTRGVSLERITPTANGSDRRTWSSSVDPEGGTPGRANSIAAASASGSDEEPLRVGPSPFSPDHDGDKDFTSISYNLTVDRPLIRVTVFDSRGRPVRHLTRGLLSSRSGTLIWDGFSDAGLPAPTGIYIVYLHATDADAGRVESHKTVVVVAGAGR